MHAVFIVPILVVAALGRATLRWRLCGSLDTRTGAVGFLRVAAGVLILTAAGVLTSAEGPRRSRGIALFEDLVAGSSAAEVGASGRSCAGGAAPGAAGVVLDVLVPFNT